MGVRAIGAALIAACVLIGCASRVAELAAAAPEEPIVFTARDGQTVEAFEGTFVVPERRGVKGGRQLTLHYVRFPATTDTPGAPIIYLAGGPGGSGVQAARGRRFPLFMALRSIGDVIALDQRGTGASNEVPGCQSGEILPHTEPSTSAGLAAAYRATWDDCRVMWESQGVDIAGYNTTESAADLEDLRRHLGAPKVSLWGISYGTHLAFEALKQMDGRIERVILASAEGPAQTVKLPARTDDYFVRLENTINANVRDGGPIDLIGLVRRVFARLEAEPVTLPVRRGDGDEAPLTIGVYDAQMLMSFTIADPANMDSIFQVFRFADEGDFQPMVNMIARHIRQEETVSINGMAMATDIASGISSERSALVKAQAETSLLSDVLNFPMPHMADVAPDLLLPDAFRQNTVTDVPTLLLTGSLDGRTYPAAQSEAVSGFTYVTRVTVDYAGHNLFMATPEVTDIILAFMRGEAVASQVIEAPRPSFVP